MSELTHSITCKIRNGLDQGKIRMQTSKVGKAVGIAVLKYTMHSTLELKETSFMNQWSVTSGYDSWDMKKSIGQSALASFWHPLRQRFQAQK